VSRESRSLSTPINQTATGAPRSTTTPSGQWITSSEAAMNPIAVTRAIGRTTSSTALAKRATSLVMTETTSPSGARTTPPTGCSTLVERVARSRCCNDCSA
jgi:hypothetical protein